MRFNICFCYASIPKHTFTIKNRDTIIREAQFAYLYRIITILWKGYFSIKKALHNTYIFRLEEHMITSYENHYSSFRKQEIENIGLICFYFKKA